MISRSIYICSRREPLEKVLGELGIAPSNISKYGKGAPHLEVKKNGALVEQVHGDFTHAVDFDLFDRELSSAILAFELLSKRGVEVAMPVEEDDDPEVYHLWRNGNKLLVRIDEDDNDEEYIKIIDPLGDVGLQ